LRLAAFSLSTKFFFLISSLNLAKGFSFFSPGLLLLDRAAVAGLEGDFLSDGLPDDGERFFIISIYAAKVGLFH
jgi:hypothetical protein